MTIDLGCIWLVRVVEWTHWTLFMVIEVPLYVTIETVCASGQMCVTIYSGYMCVFIEVCK